MLTSQFLKVILCPDVYIYFVSKELFKSFLALQPRKAMEK
jgi:hypothetical protein